MQAVRRLIPTVAKASTRFYMPVRQFGGTFCIFGIHVVVEFTFKAGDEEIEVECDAGENLLEIAQGNDVELKSRIKHSSRFGNRIGTCGGGGSCGECIVTFPAEIFAKLPKAGESETELLKKMNAPAK